MSKLYYLYDINPDGDEVNQIIPVCRDANGKIPVPYTFLTLSSVFDPASGIFVRNPIYGSEYISIDAEYNRAGDVFWLGKIINKTQSPNGEILTANGKKITCRYSSIGFVDFVADGERFNGGNDILSALHNAIEYCYGQHSNSETPDDQPS